MPGCPSAREAFLHCLALWRLANLAQLGDIQRAEVLAVLQALRHRVGTAISDLPLKESREAVCRPYARFVSHNVKILQYIGINLEIDIKLCIAPFSFANDVNTHPGDA